MAIDGEREDHRAHRGGIPAHARLRDRVGAGHKHGGEPSGYGLSNRVAPARLQVRFVDREGNTVSDHGDHLRLSITSKECTAAQAMENGQEPQENPIYQLVEEDNGCFLFYEGSFVTIPKDLDNPVLSADRVRSKNVEWSFNFYLQPDRQAGWEALPPSPSNRVQPGIPYGLGLLHAKAARPSFPSAIFLLRRHLKMLPIGSFAQPLEVQNDSTLPPIEMAVLDKFGNRTSPEGSRQKWKVVVDSEFVEGLSSSDDCEAEVSNDGLVSLASRVSYGGNIGPAGEETAVGCINCSTMKGDQSRRGLSAPSSAPPSAIKMNRLARCCCGCCLRSFLTP